MLKSKYEKFKSINVVFDGYSEKHNQSRTTTKLASLEIRDNTKLIFTREEFLENTKNKEKLIKLLCAGLEKEGFSAIHCKGDTDVSLVKSRIEFVEVGRNAVVVAEDTEFINASLESRSERTYIWDWKIKEIKK